VALQFHLAHAGIALPPPTRRHLRRTIEEVIGLLRKVRGDSV
jgi:hypothetical protein